MREPPCPNIGDGWKERQRDFMIPRGLYPRCTFCNVATGRPDLLDPHEPEG
jgi:lipoic acid synthetase